MELHSDSQSQATSLHPQGFLAMAKWSLKLRVYRTFCDPKPNFTDLQCAHEALMKVTHGGLSKQNSEDMSLHSLTSSRIAYQILEEGGQGLSFLDTRGCIEAIGKAYKDNCLLPWLWKDSQTESKNALTRLTMWNNPQSYVSLSSSTICVHRASDWQINQVLYKLRRQRALRAEGWLRASQVPTISLLRFGYGRRGWGSNTMEFGERFGEVEEMFGMKGACLSSPFTWPDPSLWSTTVDDRPIW